jgi:hypothetical protein
VKHRIGLSLFSALAIAGAGPAAAQTGAPLSALLEADYLLSVGEVVDAARWRESESVVGAAADTMVTERSQTQFDQLYVPRVVEGRTLMPGDMLQFFRLDRRIDDPTTREPLGTLLLPTGVGRVDSLAGETAAVRVTQAFHPILLGDYVRLAGEANGSPQGAGAVVGSSTGTVVAFQEEKAIHPPFDKLFLRPAAGAPVAPGQVVELYRPGPVRDGVRLPDLILGKAMVVRAGGGVAGAVSFELEQADLAPGDLYRALPPDPGS